MSKRIVLLQALAATPTELTLLLKGMTGEAIWQRPTPDQWAVADVVNHLVYVERRYLERLRRLVVEERPYLPTILPDETKHDRQVMHTELITHFKEARDGTLLFLKEITLGSWQRTAVHETRGDVTLHFLVQFLIEHDIVHLNQIAEIQQQMATTDERINGY